MEDSSLDWHRLHRTDNLKKLTKSCLEENMPDTAAYYADKLVTFSGFERETVLLLAKVWKPDVAKT